MDKRERESEREGTKGNHLIHSFIHFILFPEWIALLSQTYSHAHALPLSLLLSFLFLPCMCRTDRDMLDRQINKRTDGQM